MAHFMQGKVEVASSGETRLKQGSSSHGPTQTGRHIDTPPHTLL